MQLRRCPNCSITVVPSDDGACPSCRKRIAAWVDCPPIDAKSATDDASIPVAGLADKYCRTCGKEPPTGDAKCSCGVHPLGGRNYCPHCRFPTYTDESKCPGCHAVIASGLAKSRRTLVAGEWPHDPWQMVFLTLIVLPGLAQILLGQTNKGLLMMLLSVIGGIPLKIIGAVDAFRVAKKLKAGKAVAPWDWF